MYSWCFPAMPLLAIEHHPPSLFQPSPAVQSCTEGQKLSLLFLALIQNFIPQTYTIFSTKAMSGCSCLSLKCFLPFILSSLAPPSGPFSHRFDATVFKELFKNQSFCTSTACSKCSLLENKYSLRVATTSSPFLSPTHRKYAPSKQM